MRCPARLLLLTLLASALSAADDPAAAKQYPEAGELIAKAIDWAKWHDEQQFHRLWTFNYHRTIRRLTDDEQVKSTETATYDVYPLEGEQFYEQVRQNGQPLNASELRKEEKRKSEFLEKARKKASGDGGDDNSDAEDLKFDRELIERYRAEVVGMEEIGGRSAYVVRFEPRDGPLPVRRRIDHALNSSRGKLWIDREEFVVLQLEFELMNPVRVWAGLLGSVSRLHGRLRLKELGGGAWHYETMEFYVKGRVLFRSFHEDRKMRWDNFERITTQAAR